jgi:hypothetical protein
MVSTFKSKTLITDLYLMNPPDSRRCYFLPPYIFEWGSLSQRIEEMCFADYSLKSICIPKNVDFIDGSAFVGC